MVNNKLYKDFLLLIEDMKTDDNFTPVMEAMTRDIYEQMISNDSLCEATMNDYKNFNFHFMKGLMQAEAIMRNDRQLNIDFDNLNEVSGVIRKYANIAEHKYHNNVKIYEMHEAMKEWNIYFNRNILNREDIDDEELEKTWKFYLELEKDMKKINRKIMYFQRELN